MDINTPNPPVIETPASASTSVQSFTLDQGSSLTPTPTPTGEMQPAIVTNNFDAASPNLTLDAWNQLLQYYNNGQLIVQEPLVAPGEFLQQNGLQYLNTLDYNAYGLVFTGLNWDLGQTPGTGWVGFFRGGEGQELLLVFNHTALSNGPIVFRTTSSFTQIYGITINGNQLFISGIGRDGSLYVTTITLTQPPSTSYIQLDTQGHTFSHISTSRFNFNNNDLIYNLTLMHSNVNGDGRFWENMYFILSDRDGRPIIPMSSLTSAFARVARDRIPAVMYGYEMIRDSAGNLKLIIHLTRYDGSAEYAYDVEVMLQPNGGGYVTPAPVATETSAVSTSTPPPVPTESSTSAPSTETPALSPTLEYTPTPLPTTVPPTPTPTATETVETPQDCAVNIHNYMTGNMFPGLMTGNLDLVNNPREFLLGNFRSLLEMTRAELLEVFNQPGYLVLNVTFPNHTFELNDGLGYRYRAMRLIISRNSAGSLLYGIEYVRANNNIFDPRTRTDQQLLTQLDALEAGSADNYAVYSIGFTSGDHNWADTDITSYPDGRDFRIIFNPNHRGGYPDLSIFRPSNDSGIIFETTGQNGWSDVDVFTFLNGFDDALSASSFGFDLGTRTYSCRLD